MRSPSPSFSLRPPHRLMDTPPPPAAPGGGTETAKRARKRSRYLTDDYETPTLLNDLHGTLHDGVVTTPPPPPPPPPPRKGVVPVNEGAALHLHLHLQEANVAAADLLAALHRSAACPYDLPGPGGVDAGALLGFFTLHRASVSVSVPSTHRGKDTTVISSSSSKDDAASAAPRLNPCRAMALVHGSAGNGKEQADAVAMEHSAYAHHTAGPANAAAALGVGVGVAGGATGPSKRRNKKKKVTFALGATGCSAQPQPAATHTASGITSSTPNKAAKNKKATLNSSPRQGQHYGKPVALILQFAQGAAADQPLPTKEQLHTTFRGFGPLIELSTEITKKQARIVFQSSAAAEAAYSCVHRLGAFAATRLQYLRPPPPAPKIPLTDVRKNLEKMIASLTGPSLLGKDSAWSLAGEMQHLLFKVDRALGAAGAGPSTSAAAHHH